MESLRTRSRHHGEWAEGCEGVVCGPVGTVLGGFRVRLRELTVLLGLGVSPKGQREPFPAAMTWLPILS